jgi:general secretion pathway protein I
LIEALVALAVVSAALSAIGALVATSARGGRSIEQHVALVETARAIVAGLPKRDALAVGNFSGETAGHRWRVDVLPLAAGAANASAKNASTTWVPHAVVVNVRSPSGGRIELNTLRLHRRAGG